MYSILEWLVIPGGPGMSNIYLKHILPNVFKEFNLHFYDVYGSPESEKQDVSIEVMVEQIETQVSDFKEGYGLITHSFGNYLALRVLEKQNSPLKAIIMINPMPFNYHGWNKALENVVKKVPVQVLNKISNLSKQQNKGSEIFRLIYPYYVGNLAHVLPVDVPFDITACNKIASKVNDFNDINLVIKANLPIIRIVGKLDPFFIDKTILLEQTFILNKVGHYPFFEDYAQFANLVAKIQKFFS